MTTALALMACGGDDEPSTTSSVPPTNGSEPAEAPATFARPADLAAVLGCTDSFQEGTLDDSFVEDHRESTGSCWLDELGKVVLNTFESAVDLDAHDAQKRGLGGELATQFGFDSLHHARCDRWTAEGDADVDGTVADALAELLDGEAVHIACGP